MPENGAVLVISNHQSFFDPVLVGLASRRYLSYLARDTLFRNKFFAALITSLDAIPIDNKGLGKEGLQRTLAALESGSCVLVFPEGERTRDGAMLPFKAGISLLVRKVKCPIVPVGIAGAFAALPRSGKKIGFSPILQPPNAASIALSVGKPIDPAILLGMDRDEGLRFLHQKVADEFERAKQIKRQKRD
jgi:1-acyl-sn-glycerol-3-phosphate acyltransferase